MFNKIFNLDAGGLSPEVRDDINKERTKYLSILFFLITNKLGIQSGVEKYGNLLMIAPSLQVNF